MPAELVVATKLVTVLFVAIILPIVAVVRFAFDKANVPTVIFVIFALDETKVAIVPVVRFAFDKANVPTVIFVIFALDETKVAIVPVIVLNVPFTSSVALGFVVAIPTDPLLVNILPIVLRLLIEIIPFVFILTKESIVALLLLISDDIYPKWNSSDVSEYKIPL